MCAEWFAIYWKFGVVKCSAMWLSKKKSLLFSLLWTLVKIQKTWGMKAKCKVTVGLHQPRCRMSTGIAALVSGWYLGGSDSGSGVKMNPTVHMRAPGAAAWAAWCTFGFTKGSPMNPWCCCGQCVQQVCHLFCPSPKSECAQTMCASGMVNTVNIF